MNKIKRIEKEILSKLKNCINKPVKPSTIKEIEDRVVGYLHKSIIKEAYPPFSVAVEEGREREMVIKPQNFYTALILAGENPLFEETIKNRKYETDKYVYSWKGPEKGMHIAFKEPLEYVRLNIQIKLDE